LLADLCFFSPCHFDLAFQEEESMAAADGMNRFAAYVILCQITVDDFLEMVPEERITKFGPFIGNDRMVTGLCWAPLAMLLIILC